MDINYENWISQHQPWELNFHQQYNFRWDDNLWNQQWNNIFLNFCGFTKDYFNHSKTLLDIGCGSRPCLEWFINNPKRYYLDPLIDEFKNIPQVKSYWNNKNTICQPAEYYIDSLYQKCDFIICWNVLDHTYNPKQILGNIYKYIKLNGTILLSFDNKPPDIGHPGLNYSTDECIKYISNLFYIDKIEEHFVKRDIVLLLRRK